MKFYVHQIGINYAQKKDAHSVLKSSFVKCAQIAERPALGSFFPGHFSALLPRLGKADRNGLLAVLYGMFSRAHVVHLCPHFFAGFLAVLAPAGFLSRTSGTGLTAGA